MVALVGEVFSWEWEGWKGMRFFGGKGVGDEKRV